MRMDDVLPRWQFGEHHDIEVAGSAAVTAVERVTWGEVPLFRVLLFAASFGRTWMPADRPFMDQLTSGGFTVLSRTEDALVVGAVVRVTGDRGPVPLGDDPLATFRAVDGPGHYKVAFDFRVRNGVLHTETRVLVTDEETRRRFRRYWRLIRIPSGLIRTEWLRAARRREAA